MRCCCEDYPSILEFVLNDPGPITRLLAWATKRFAFKTLERAGRPRGDPPNKPITPEQERQAMLFLVPSFALLERVFDAAARSAHAREEFLAATAVNGGLEVCRAVMGPARAVPTLGVTSVGADGEDGGSGGWWVAHVGLIGRLWEAYAAHFKLRLCSNKDCVAGVLESRRAQFKSCSACGVAQYCARECQLAHWKKSHKAECDGKKIKKDTGKTS